LPEKNERIAVFMSFSGQGGVERMMLNLCEGLISLGHPVDLLLIKDRSRYLTTAHPDIRIVKLRASHALSALPELVRYLKRERPAALLAAKDRANRIAIAARMLAGAPTRLGVRMGTHVSASLEGKPRIVKALWRSMIRFFYGRADEIVGNSRGIVEDLSAIAGLPMARMTVIPNPVVTDRTAALAARPVSHPWFVEGGPPVILGSGRLTRQKDFPTLIRAFARVRRRRACRLVILGEGRDRAKLECLAGELGVAEDVDLPGFVDNPYAHVAKASVFALSSIWEGAPNVLVEALALGTPSVAADCPSGPAEILAGGRYGRLVPPGDAEALAGAIVETLENPPDGEMVKDAVVEYSMAASSRRYRDLLLKRPNTASRQKGSIGNSADVAVAGP
jgi:glycosyltransferase involved in cell wall biosynthesis